MSDDFGDRMKGYEMPVFSKVVNRVQVIFDGASPAVVEPTEIPF